MKVNNVPNSVLEGSWPKIDLSLIPKDQVEQFCIRRDVVQKRLAGYSYATIKKITGVPASTVSYLVDRFTTILEDGNLCGELALIPYARVKSYVRKKPVAPKRSEQQGGCSGCLSDFLRAHPEIEGVMIFEITKNKAQTFSKHQDYIKYLYIKFRNLIATCDLPESAWPNNTKNKGRRSIEKYIKKLISEHMSEFVHAHGDKFAKAHIFTGTGKSRFLQANRPGDVVQLDGHYIDATFTIRIEVAEDVYQEITTDRIWLIVAEDENSKCVLAYRLVLKSQISAADVRHVLADVCTGHWQPISPTKDTCHRYRLGSGLPSGVIPGWRGMSFACLSVDSHLSNVASKISYTARQDFGFSHCVGPVQRFESRSEIERLFKEVARKVQLLPSTTGSSPHNGRDSNAKEKAIKYHIDLCEFRYALDVELANYCITPTEGLGCLSPLEYISQILASGFYMRKIPDSMQEKVAADLSTRVCIVRGSVNSGRRPYVQLDRVKYTNDILADMGDLIGSELYVSINSDDYRSVEAYLPNGSYIGYLLASGFWREFKHTVETRRLVNSLIRSGELRIFGPDPVSQITDHFIKSGHASRSLLVQQEHSAEATHVVKPPKRPQVESDIFLIGESETESLPSAGSHFSRE